MNTKLLLSTVSILLVSSCFGAKSDLIIVNHTPFEIKAHYMMGPLGKQNIRPTIKANSENKFEAGAETKGIEIYGIKTLVGDKNFGGKEDFVVLKDDLGGAKPGSMTWHLFCEEKFEIKSSGGLTFTATPNAVKFFLVRANKPVWPGQGGVVDESPWYDISGEAQTVKA